MNLKEIQELTLNGEYAAVKISGHACRAIVTSLETSYDYDKYGGLYSIMATVKIILDDWKDYAEVTLPIEFLSPWQEETL